MGEKQDNLIVILMFLHLFFANSNLNVVQISLELLLMVLFIVRLKGMMFSSYEILVFYVFIFVSSISLALNPLAVFLINFKVFGLAILTLVYFSKVHVRPNVIWIIFIVNLLFIFQQVFTGRHLASPLILEIGGYFNTEAHMDARPLGLFMNTHQSALFMALCFIYYGMMTRLYGVGLVALYCSGSVFTFVSYFAQVVANSRLWKLIPNVMYKALKVIFFLSFFIVVIFMLNASLVVDALASYEFELLQGLFTADRIYGIQLIIRQIFDHDLLVKLLTLYPLDSAEIVDGREAVGLIGNEVAYFRYILQSGIILFTLYFIYLLKHIKYFRVFILVSLLHYGDIAAPLFIFMMVTFSRIIQSKDDSIIPSITFNRKSQESNIQST